MEKKRLLSSLILPCSILCQNSDRLELKLALSESLTYSSLFENYLILTISLSCSVNKHVFVLEVVWLVDWLDGV